MEKAADELEAFVIRDVCRGLLRKGSAIEVMREIGLNNRGRHSCAHRDGVDRHRDSGFRGAELSEVA